MTKEIITAICQELKELYPKHQITQYNDCIVIHCKKHQIWIYQGRAVIDVDDNNGAQTTHKIDYNDPEMMNNITKHIT